MKKVILIRTPFVFPVKHFSSITSVPDIGTAYINGTLIKNGYDSCIIDAAGEGVKKRYQIKGTHLAIGGISAEEIISKIPADVDYIGLQSMHSNRWIYDSFILKKAMEKFPKAKFFLGGENVTATYEKILKQFPTLDACVIGEGEETVLELLHAFDNDLPVDHIAGIAFNYNGKLVETPRRSRKRAVDEIPAPSWKGVPVENYLKNCCGINSLARRSMPVMATRGCPYSCTFCTVPNMWDSKWYARDPGSVVADIMTYVSDFGINHVDFVDLTIVINKKWMHEFCDLLIEANLDITWAIPIGTRTENIDKELLVKMKKSGLSRVLYSAESGSKETLDRIKKCLSIDHFEEVVRETARLDICVKIAFIFGFPGQTLLEVFDSFLLINKLAWLGASDIVCLSFVPYPKTELYDELDVDYDYNDPENNIRLNNDIPRMKSWSTHFGDSALRSFIWFFTLYFYGLQFLFRPVRFFRFCKRVFVDKLPLTNFESIIFNMINKSELKTEEEDVLVTIELETSKGDTSQQSSNLINGAS